jgi:arylsulfate sulfotransferase
MATAVSSGSFNSTVSPTNNPLVARYTITVPDGSQVSIQFGLTTAYGTSTWQVDAPTGGGEVSILVAGMRASTTYHMAALIHLRTGTTIGDSDHTFTTGALPTEHLPGLSATTYPASGTPCPGVELVNLNPMAACVADLQGNILWYYLNQADLQQDGHPMPLRPLSNGNMMALITNRYTPDQKTPYCVLREFDLAGDTVSNQYGLREIDMPTLNGLLLNVPTRYGRTVQVNYFSHDFYPMTNGHVILLCQEFLTVEVNGQNTLVWGDALVDLDESFTPVWVWSAFDVLDVNRHPYEWLPNGYDWTHCNTIEPTPDGNLLLGVRNQSWVLKLAYANGTGTGEILWKMGFEGDFTLMRGGEPDPNTADWFFAQHYPHILTSAYGYITSMTVVDNGNYRAGTYPNPYSRGLIVNVDEQKRTVEVAWQYPVTPDFYSYWGGNVVQLPNGNMEICMSRPLPADPKPLHSFAREVTFQTQELVWQLDITPPYAYRSYRIPSLYPGVQW